MTAPAATSAMAIVEAIAAGELSPKESVAFALRRIDELNPSVTAFAWIREAALDDARASEKRLASGEPVRPLEGVPFTVKDLCAIEDGPTNYGSRAFAGYRAGVDAEVVARLRRAGAILVGTTTTSEFGNRPTAESALFGPTRNPWDLGRTSGGSSGGAAVAAVLGMAPLNQGSDGGGSLRVPAACCGVYGLKPQRGRISLAPLRGEDWSGLAGYGPITVTVADAATFLDVTAGPSAGDPYWAPPPALPFADACTRDRRVRVAVAYERDGESVDHEVTEAVRRTALLLEELGHRVTEAQPDLSALESPFLTISTVGIGELPLDDHQHGVLEPRTRRIIDAAAEVRAVSYVRAVHAMHEASRKVARFFESYDVLLTPTVSRAAPLLGEIGADAERAWADYRNWLCWTWPWNCTGQPAASVPAGFSESGLPLGVQLVARAAEEDVLLSLSAQIERARPWIARRPPLWPTA